MKVLWISEVMPYPLSYGSAVRTFHTLRHRNPEHHHTFCYLQPGAQARDTPVHPQILELADEVHRFRRDMSRRRAQLYSLARFAAYEATMAHSKELATWVAAHAAEYDIAVLDKTQMAWVDLPPGMPHILNMHNIEAEIGIRSAATDDNWLRARYRQFDAASLARFERNAVRSADEVWIPSQREADVIEGWGLGVPVVVVPNGTDTDHYQPGVVAEADRFDLLFVGTTHYFPNYQGIMWFLDKAWPAIQRVRPGTVIRVVGGDPPPALRERASDTVKIDGWVRDILPFYQQARVTVVPLLSGSGTRLKLLETAAVGTPFVSTSVGSEGIHVQDRVHCRIEDDPEAFAAACVTLLSDGDQRAALAASARGLVLEHYSYAAIGKEMADLVDRFAARHGR